MTEFDDAFFSGFDDLLSFFGEEEQVIYHPRGGRTPRPMDAIVDRSPGEIFIAGDIVVPVLVVRVHNVARYGIDHNEIDNGDKIEVSIKPRAKRSIRTFKVVENSDGGVTSIAVF